MKSVKEATLSGAKWGLIERFSVQGIRFILGLIMARLLSPADYGQVGMIMFFIVISDTLVDSGFNNALIRKKDQTEEDYSTVFYFNLAIATFCYIVLYLIAPWVASFFNMPLLKSLLRLQSLSVIINALLAVQMTKLTIDLNFKAIAKCNLISSLLSGVLGVILAYTGYGVWALVWQTLFACTVNLICVFISCRWLPLLSFSKNSFYSMFSYGSKLLASSLINRVYQNLTTLIIGKFYNAKDLGMYDRGAGLAAFPVNNINEIMQKITFPILAKVNDNQSRLIDIYRKYIKLQSLVIFFICILMAALAKPIIIFLLGDKWGGAIIFLQFFSFSVCFNHIDGMNLNLLYVKGKSGIVLKLELLKKTISTLILLASIPFGVVAICFSRVLHTQLTVLCDGYYIGKLFNYGVGKQLKDVWKYFVFSLIACSPAFILSFTSISELIILITGGIVSPFLYYVFLYKDPQMKELVTIVKSMIKKQ